MNIKSVLLGSAAAMLAVSAAQAADAIVAAAPEPAEYVRVCDAFGTGYFYIPGTETCLKFGGQLRFTVKGNDLNDKKDASKGTTGANWADEMRTRINISTKTDSEWGPIGTEIQLQSKYKSGSTSDSFNARYAYISVGGFSAGRLLSYGDNNGNNSYWNSFVNTALANSDTAVTGARYEYKTGPLSFGVTIDDLQDATTAGTSAVTGTKYSKDIGFEAQMAYKQGALYGYLWGLYDNYKEHGVVYGHIEDTFGPHLLQLDAEYASGVNAYETKYNWQVSGVYEYSVNKQFALGPAVTYYKYFDTVKNGDNYWQIGGDAYYYLQKDKASKTFVQAGLAYSTYDKTINSYVRLRRDF
ncbi:porin [Allorhizobium sp. BGMRC 0089]|uniref:porin n=1 Tax=Allorhizobium sonneratiae TaxID=2934936 RepID=UPI002033BA24|nr:porin [Allorhizobium sonneratiae]MCM2291969.1 porin [Allorhizobium sonneratiae]